MAKGAPKGTRYGGREKGTPNKVTKELRERIKGFLDDNFEEAVKTWKDIEDPKDKMKLYNELIPFAVPKMASVQVSGEVSTTSVEDRLKELSENE